MKSCLVIILLLTSIGVVNGQTNNFDHSLFDKLLKENVDDNGLVNYEEFIDNKSFDEYITGLQNAEIDNFSGREKLAFLINAYNALVIKNVLNHWPIKSPMDVEGFFDKKIFNLAGESVTLNQIEYDYVFNIDPVFCHFGLVCAGMSCPKLLQKAYNGEDIYEQLESNTRLFLNDQSKNRLDKESNTLHLSEIFRWFEDVFSKKYGSEKEAAAEFMNDADSNYISENKITIKFIKYDWKLNKQ